MSFSTFLVTELLQAIAHGEPYAAPETWVGLFNRAGAELSNADYVRVQVSIPPGDFPSKWSAPLVSAGAGRVENIGTIIWPRATVDWQDVVSVRIYDAETGGNELARESLPSPKSVSAGEAFRIPNQALKIRIT